MPRHVQSELLYLFVLNVCAYSHVDTHTHTYTHTRCSCKLTHQPFTTSLCVQELGPSISDVICQVYEGTTDLSCGCIDPPLGAASSISFTAFSSSDLAHLSFKLLTVRSHFLNGESCGCSGGTGRLLLCGESHLYRWCIYCTGMTHRSQLFPNCTCGLS